MGKFVVAQKTMTVTKPYKIFSDPFRFYFSMLREIENATKAIYLQTYRFHNDTMGIRFRDTLVRKAKEGLKVKIIVDSWGTRVGYHFFDALTEAGGEVIFYKKIKLFLDFFTKNHRRNHRKLLLIDHRIGFIGSANISEYALNWRECVLRVQSPVVLELEKSFCFDLKNHNKYSFKKSHHLKELKADGFTILRDFPSIRKQQIMRFFQEIIQEAKSEILLETPYFLPGSLLRNALIKAAERGVRVTIVLPKHSDVRIVDVLRTKYLGSLHEAGIVFRFYIGNNLHAKDILIDQNKFAIGSVNFDYRSFRYMHEILITGSHETIVQQLHEHIRETIENSSPFDYETWRKRPFIQKFFENVLVPFRHLL
jgi:cardiolipin synthase